MLAWWRRLSVLYLGCQGGFFRAPRCQNFMQMAACASAYADARKEFHHTQDSYTQTQDMHIKTA